MWEGIMSKKNKVVVTVVLIAVIMLIVGGSIFFLTKKTNQSKDKVYVEKASAIVQSGMEQRNLFTGIVETQDSVNIQMDTSKKLNEIYVKEGQSIVAGTKLFSYDTKELRTQIEQGKLELEGIQNEITGFQSQIVSLTAEKANAPKESQFEYTTQIQSIQNSIKQSEYNLQNKKLELGRIEKEMKSGVITSKIDGVIKSINEKGVDNQGQEVPFMTIVASGNYRIKGTVSELHVSEFQPEQKVTIYSRVDEKAQWVGSIIKVDLETKDNQNGENNQEEGNAEQASRYPFFVSLEDATGLILGQHVYISLEDPQTVKVDHKGILVYGSYLQKEGEKLFAWVEDSNGEIQKKVVKANLLSDVEDLYDMVEGIEEEDYVACPMEAIKEGMKTIRSLEGGHK